MKKLMITLPLIMLSGCASLNGSSLAADISKTIFAEAVNYKCRSELNNQPIYQAASMLLSKEQKAKFESKTCSCVARQAPESVTLEELAQAAINSETRAKVVTSAISKTLGTCIKEIF